MSLIRVLATSLENTFTALQTFNAGVVLGAPLSLPAYATGSLPSGVAGQLAYDSTLNLFKFYNGSAWVAGGGAPTGSNGQVQLFSSGALAVGSHPLAVDLATGAVTSRYNTLDDASGGAILGPVQIKTTGSNAVVITGLGSTNSTLSLLVQNSASVMVLSILDDASINVGGPINFGVSAYISMLGQNINMYSGSGSMGGNILMDKGNIYGSDGSGPRLYSDGTNWFCSAGLNATLSGDGSGITGLNYSQLSGSPGNPFDQSLNTTDSPTFVDLTATLGYVAATASNWAGSTPPLNVQAAIDRLAAWMNQSGLSSLLLSQP